MVGLGLTVDLSVFERRMAHIAGQIPYAIAVALTRTAQDSKAALISGLPRHFTVRSGWLKKGMRIDPARKTDLRAHVGSVDPFMEAQALGGEKRSKNGSVAIPQVGQGRPRATIGTATRPSKWPGALNARDDVFIGRAGHKSKGAGGTFGVWQRLPKAQRKKTGKGLRLLYLLEDRVNIPARWPIEEEVGAVVHQRWPEHVTNAINHAIATAR